MELNIIRYTADLKAQIIAVWEMSVRATHDFLQPADIDYYRAIVSEIDFGLFDVHCCTTVGNDLIGFIGVADHKVEMLFVAPAFIGKGVGKLLLNFAINDLKANEVDVNEGNIHALGFYKKAGFVVYDRMPVDSEGKPYPILKMRLAKPRIDRIG